MKNLRITFCIVSSLLLLLSVISGYIVLQIDERNIVEDYFCDFVIAEELIIDDQELAEIYGAGKPIVIPAGTHGRIEDSITTIGGDTKGYEYINAYINDVNGISLNVAISIVSNVDNDVLIAETDLYPMAQSSNWDSSKTRIIYPVISISKIESYQVILSEYEKSREKYYSRIKVAKLKGIATAIGLSVVLCGGFGLFFRKAQTTHKGKMATLRFILISLTALLIIFLLFPRKYTYLDGGSVAYGSVGLGFIYRVEQRHRTPSIVDADGYGYYENGTVISVFGIEIYNNAHTDYNNLAVAPHDPNHEIAPYN